MNYLFIGPIVALLVWATLQVRTLMRNYRAACATGLSIIICPYDPDSVSFYPSFDTAVQFLAFSISVA
jgi:hypothetical protein